MIADPPGFRDGRFCGRISLAGETGPLMTSVQLRVAGPADAETLAALGAATFTETFGHLYPPEDLADFLGRQHTPALYAAWAADGRYRLWLAEQDGRAV